MSTSVPTDPNELRPLLHERLEQWAAADLPLLHRVMLELERDRLVAQLNEEFDRDRESGRLARLPEIIRDARTALAPGPAPAFWLWIYPCPPSRRPLRAWPPG